MSYKYSSGPQIIGDLKAKDDAQRDTIIDFGEDRIDFQTSGSTRMSITNDGVQVTGLTVGDAYSLPATDGNANQVLTTDGNGNLSFQAAAVGSGSNPPGGADRHVQFNDNGSFAGNSGILVDEDFNLKISGSLVIKESIGIGTDLGGGRNSSDQWVSISGPESKLHVIGDVTQNAAFSIDQASDTVGGTYWSFAKARGTPASPSGVNTGDEISRIEFHAHTGSSNLKRSAMIYTTADSDGDGRMRFYATHNGDTNNIAMDLYDNKVTFGDQVVIGASGMNPISNGGASIGGASNRFENIQANNVFAYESFKVGGTHTIYDRGGHGLTINKNVPIIGNYSSGEGLAYVSNYSGVENVIFALHKTGSHFGGIAINGSDENNDEKVIFFSKNNTAGFEWKNNIPYYNSNGLGNLETNGTSLMQLNSNGNLNITQGNLTVGAITIPNTDGTSGQVLKTDGAGNLTWQNESGGGSSTFEEQKFIDPNYSSGSQANRSFTFKRHYNFSGASANNWHTVFSFRPYKAGTTTDPEANTLWTSVGMRVQINGHTSGAGNGYRSSTGHVEYNGSSANSATSSEITLGSCVGIRFNLTGWVTEFQINPNQANASQFDGSVSVEIYFPRGAGSNGDNIEWSIT